MSKDFLSLIFVGKLTLSGQKCFSMALYGIAFLFKTVGPNLQEGCFGWFAITDNEDFHCQKIRFC